MLQGDLFGNWSLDPELNREEGSIRYSTSQELRQRVGIIEDGKQCKDCTKLLKMFQNEATFYKCSFIGVNANDIKTDIIIHWPACSKADYKKYEGKR